MSQDKINEALERIAERIADGLFTNGAHQHASRLVLELNDGRDGGGWCEGAVKDQAVSQLLPLRKVLEAVEKDCGTWRHDLSCAQKGARVHDCNCGLGSLRTALAELLEGE